MPDNARKAAEMAARESALSWIDAERSFRKDGGKPRMVALTTDELNVISAALQASATRPASDPESDWHRVMTAFAEERKRSTEREDLSDVARAFVKGQYIGAKYALDCAENPDDTAILAGRGPLAAHCPASDPDGQSGAEDDGLGILPDDTVRVLAPWRVSRVHESRALVTLGYLEGWFDLSDLASLTSPARARGEG